MHERYAILDTLEISLWENHLSSPWVSFESVLYPRCLVLLAYPVVQLKVLQGMLSVLALKKNQMAIAWPKSDNEELQNLLATLVRWSPDSILIMGKTLAALLAFHTNIFTQVTYHPDELVQMPFHKPEAYQDLLKLKQYLSM